MNIEQWDVHSATYNKSAKINRMNIFGQWLRLSFCWDAQLNLTHLASLLTRKSPLAMAKMKIVAHLSAFEDHLQRNAIIYKNCTSYYCFNKNFREQIEPIKNLTNQMNFSSQVDFHLDRC